MELRISDFMAKARGVCVLGLVILICNVCQSYNAYALISEDKQLRSDSSEAGNKHHWGLEDNLKSCSGRLHDLEERVTLLIQGKRGGLQGGQEVFMEEPFLLHPPPLRRALVHHPWSRYFDLYSAVKLDAAAGAVASLAGAHPGEPLLLVMDIRGRFYIFTRSAHLVHEEDLAASLGPFAPVVAMTSYIRRVNQSTVATTHEDGSIRLWRLNVHKGHVVGGLSLQCHFDGGPSTESGSCAWNDTEMTTEDVQLSQEDVSGAEASGKAPEAGTWVPKMEDKDSTTSMEDESEKLRRNGVEELSRKLSTEKEEEQVTLTDGSQAFQIAGRAPDRSEIRQAVGGGYVVLVRRGSRRAIVSHSPAGHLVVLHENCSVWQQAHLPKPALNLDSLSTSIILIGSGGPLVQSLNLMRAPKVLPCVHLDAGVQLVASVQDAGRPGRWYALTSSGVLMTLVGPSSKRINFCKIYNQQQLLFPDGVTSRQVALVSSGGHLVLVHMRGLALFNTSRLKVLKEGPQLLAIKTWADIAGESMAGVPVTTWGPSLKGHPGDLRLPLVVSVASNLLVVALGPDNLVLFQPSSFPRASPSAGGGGGEGLNLKWLQPLLILGTVLMVGWQFSRATSSGLAPPSRDLGLGMPHLSPRYRSRYRRGPRRGAMQGLRDALAEEDSGRRRSLAERLLEPSIPEESDDQFEDD